MNSQLSSNLTLGSKVGSGFFGDVFEGDDPIHGKVAVKIFEKMPSETPLEWSSRKQDLLQEGQRLKTAEHENVVRVFQILENKADDKVLLIMEYCNGGCVQDSYEQGPLPLDTLRGVLTDTALGLQAIHLRGMIHRDIKPSNILIHNGRAKLADFGLVTDDIVYGYASAAGYHDHLAKEVYDTRLTSIRSDIWALGMTTYRLLHGHAFYRSLPSPHNLVPLGNFAHKLLWLPHVPDRWRRFVRRAMHDDPSRRFQDVGQILKSLENLPITPSWQCSYSADRTLWWFEQKNRRIEVEWNVHSPRKHSWTATSLPLLEGRKKRLGGSDQMVGKTRVRRELEQFFKSFLK